MAKHRDYDNEYPSVTQLISQLASPGLMNWFKRTPFAEINRLSARGKQIGSDTHLAIHHFIETGEAKIETQYPDEVTNALKSFMLFRKEMPEVLLKNAEIALTSRTYLFNGQVDCLAEKNGEPWLADWKSQDVKDRDKPVIYDEAKIQVSAYVHLVNECQNKSIDKAIIVALAKDKVAYNTYEMEKAEIEGYFNEVFLPLLKIYNYRSKK
jgi:hypothetical protein